MTDHRIKLITPVFATVVLFFAGIPRPAVGGDESVWKKSQTNATSAQNAFVRSHRFVIGWLAHADPHNPAGSITANHNPPGQAIGLPRQ